MIIYTLIKSPKIEKFQKNLTADNLKYYLLTFSGSGSTSLPVESKHFIVKSDVYNKCNWIGRYGI